MLKRFILLGAEDLANLVVMLVGDFVIADIMVGSPQKFLVCIIKRYCLPDESFLKIFNFVTMLKWSALLAVCKDLINLV